MRKNRRDFKNDTRILPENSLGERMVKGRPNWKKTSQIKKLKIMMTVVLVTLLLSVAAGASLFWMEFQKNKPPEIPVTESLPPESEEGSQEGEETELEEAFELILGNANHPLPNDLEVKTADFQEIQVDERILTYLEDMFRAAEEDGILLKAIRGYESRELQEQKIQQEADRLQKEQGLTAVRAEDTAKIAFEESGEMEFRTGLAVKITAQNLSEDAEFEGSPEYYWLTSHCVQYGFVQRYPQNKEKATGISFSPEHFRYVGVENALKMRELNLCLEEYVCYMEEQSQK